MTASRRGAITGATWLIGLGVVLLIREVQGWSWGEAWPLFIILVGVASFIATLMSWRPGFAGIWSFTWPVAWTVGGVVLLMSTTGQLTQGPGEVFSEYWPWVAVVIGAWFVLAHFIPVARADRAARPAAGRDDRRLGRGQVRGRNAAGSRGRAREPRRRDLRRWRAHIAPWGRTVSRSNRTRRTVCRGSSNGANWDLGLTAEVPLDLRLETGANRSMLDLRELRLRSLALKTGASETRVRLPRAAGVTAVRAESGVASLTPGGAGRRGRAGPRSDGAWQRVRWTRRCSRGSATATSHPTSPQRQTGSRSISPAASARSGSSAVPPDAQRRVRSARLKDRLTASSSSTAPATGWVSGAPMRAATQADGEVPERSPADGERPHAHRGATLRVLGGSLHQRLRQRIADGGRATGDEDREERDRQRRRDRQGHEGRAEHRARRQQDAAAGEPSPVDRDDDAPGGGAPPRRITAPMSSRSRRRPCRTPGPRRRAAGPTDENPKISVTTTATASSASTWLRRTRNSDPRTVIGGRPRVDRLPAAGGPPRMAPRRTTGPC